MLKRLSNSDRFWILYAAVNFVLLAAAIAGSLLAFFASLELVLHLAAPLILRGMGDTVQAKYTLITVRNLWLLAGGMMLLGIMIYGIHCFFKRWRERRVQRLYIVLLSVEALVVLAAQFLTAV